ncbi:FabD/lysophospholipase-like protein [Aureobasidium pullulans]|nr:FabD/lysophospholipase-like protein [Aureobasidium pullulans]
MDRLNHSRKQKQLAPIKPCDVFDLIGGTSTGGLIAIMLGRLEMSVDECIKAYSGLIATVFGVQLSKIPMNWRGKVKPRFDSAKLEAAVKQVISQSGVPDDTMFDDGIERGCKTFVCSIDRYTKAMVRLRSYSLPDEQNVPATICQAALATSAATTFFAPVSIGKRSFADGAFGANNPVDEVEGEATNIWSPEMRELQPLVKCFISIGTGNPGIQAFEDGVPGFLGGTVPQIATETEATDRKFIARWARHFDEKRYFRFNVEQGLQGVGLAEFEMEGAIQAASEAYLTHTGQKSRVRDCVGNLSLKQKTTDESFATIQREYVVHVAQRLSQAKIARRTFYDVPPTAVSCFSGREEILKRIDDAFQRSADATTTSKPPVFVLQAMGGQGKSQIALEYCRRSRSRFQAIFWLDANLEASIQDGFERIAKRFDPLAAAGPHGRDEKIDLVQKKLANLKEEWLLVFDNYDDLSSYKLRPYLPTHGRGYILLTSRHEESRGYTRPGIENFLPVPSMKHDGGQEFLQNQLDDTTEQERSELLHRLGGLALAIDQATAYISFHKLSIPDFLAEYESRKHQILQHHREATWEYNKLLDDSEKEIALTAYTTWESLRIGEHVFRNYYNSVLDSPAWFNLFTETGQQESTIKNQETRPMWNGSRFQEVTRDLEQLSLVSNTGKYAKDTGVWFSIHPVVQDWLQIRMKLNLRQETLVESLCLIVEVTSLEVTEVAGADVNQELLNHVDTLIGPLQASYKDGLLVNGAVIKLAAKFGIFYLDNGQSEKAIELLEGILEVMKVKQRADHPCSVLEYLLALAYRDNGQTLVAIKLLDHVIKIRDLEETHPDRLGSQHELATAYRENGQVEEAIKLLEHVVTIRETSLAETHPNRLASQRALAIAFRVNGQVEEAIKLLERVVKLQEASRAENHPNRLASQHELAIAYRVNGQVEEAIKLLEHVVQIWQGIDEGHSHCLIAQQNLAVTYIKNEQADLGIELLAHVVKVYERTKTAEDDPRYRSSRQRLAKACQEKDRNTPQ